MVDTLDTLRSRLGPVFWLVLVGAIIGFLVGAIEIGVNVNVLINLEERLLQEQSLSALSSFSSRQTTRLALTKMETNRTKLRCRRMDTLMIIH